MCGHIEHGKVTGQQLVQREIGEDRVCIQKEFQGSRKLTIDDKKKFLVKEPLANLLKVDVFPFFNISKK